jgi:hypothetical protein
VSFTTTDSFYNIQNAIATLLLLKPPSCTRIDLHVPEEFLSCTLEFFLGVVLVSSSALPFLPSEVVCFLLFEIPLQLLQEGLLSGYD